MVPMIAAYQLVPTWIDNQSLHWSDLPTWMLVYGTDLLAHGLSFWTAVWIWNRPLCQRTAAQSRRSSVMLDGREEIAVPLALTRKCRWQSNCH